MKSIFLNLVRALARYISEVAASESGELLSVRRKWHLLEAERYARLEAEAAKAKREAAGTGGHRRQAIRRIHNAPGIAHHA
jgi:hypothetical protein